MKRLWIGVGILGVLLAAGVTVLCIGHHFYEDISKDLETAGESAMAENWEEANKRAEAARDIWNRYRRLWASFSDHEPVEKMETLFSQLEIYRKRQLEVSFAETCTEISHLAQAIEESHNLRWWSIL